MSSDEQVWILVGKKKLAFSGVQVFNIVPSLMSTHLLFKLKKFTLSE